MPKLKYNVAHLASKIQWQSGTTQTFGTYHPNAVKQVMAQTYNGNPVTTFAYRKGYAKDDDDKEVGNFLVGFVCSQQKYLIDNNHLVAAPCPPHCGAND